MHPVPAMVLAAAAGLAAAGASAPPQEPSRPATPVVLDITWLDPSGRAASAPSPAGLEVRVDGRVRRVLSMRPSPPSSRLVLLAIDEGSFPPALSKDVRALASRLVSALGAGARVALLTLPVASPRIAFTADRAALALEIERVAGRGTADFAGADAQEGGARPPVDRQSADREGRDRPDRPESPAPRDAGPPGGEAARLAPLQRVLANLRNTPGPKTVLLLAGMGGARSGPEVADGLRPLTGAAIASRAAIEVVQLPALGTAPRAPWLDEIAADTGGSVLDGRRDPEAAARALGDKVAAAFVLELEPDPADRDGRPHPVVVTPAARGRVFAPARLAGPVAAGPPASAAVRLAPTPSGAAPAPAVAPAVPPATSPSTRAVPAGRRTPRPRDAETEALLLRAADYLAEYERSLSSVVAEEDYLQRLNRQLSVVSKLGEGLGSGVDYSVLERRLRSDFLLVRSGGAGGGWLPFRDVFEVDGKPVRDREDRLRTLFLETPSAALDQARRVMSEGARYNLGDVPRTINIPTLPLLFIAPEHRDRFAWRRQGDQDVEGVRARRLDFEELERPTLVRTSRNADVPIVGTLWIDPATGRLVKGTMRAGQIRGTRVDVTVLFKPNADLGLWVPAEMIEFYQVPGQTIDATARYSNFRRFQVKTEETIKIPK
jgi:hypothetical protein